MAVLRVEGALFLRVVAYEMIGLSMCVCLVFFFFLCVWVFCLHVYLCTMCLPDACRGHQRSLDSQGLELDSCDLELTLGSLEEHLALLTAVASSSSIIRVFYYFRYGDFVTQPIT